MNRRSLSGPASGVPRAASDILSVTQAQQMIGASVAPIAQHETVDLRTARGRVLARAVISPFNVPRTTIPPWTVMHCAATREPAIAEQY